jgi:methylthioribose-1-phosphate isomerase
MTDPARPSEPAQPLEAGTAAPAGSPAGSAPSGSPAGSAPSGSPAGSAPSGTPPETALGGTPDPDRRRFFRLFAGDVMSSVGTVLGAAQLLQQQSAEAARELLGTVPAATAPADRPGPLEQPAAGAGFRAPFRWDGDVCRVIDQRRLPDTLVELEVRTAAEAVNAIRDEAIVGGAAQAQLAAIALAMLAARSVTSRPFARRATLRGAANALRNTRPASAAMTSTLDRMLAVLDAFDVQAEGEAVEMALRLEAEAVIREAVDAHGAVVEQALRLLPGEPGDPLHVLTIGSTGPMGGGQLGTAASVIAAAHHAARPVHALVAETRPGFHGSRICAWELREAGVAHAVVPDAAAPGCISAGEVEVVLVGADRVAANGDLIAVAGTYPLALAASAAGIPVIVCAPTTSIDTALATGDDAFVEQGRPSSVLYAGGARVAPEGTQIRVPLQDLTPASLVTAIVTEQGAIGPPFAARLAAHVLTAAARRAASPNRALPAPAADDGDEGAVAVTPSPSSVEATS